MAFTGGVLFNSGNVNAASNVKNVILKEGKKNAVSVQLDGKGKKEKIYYTETKSVDKKLSKTDPYRTFYVINTKVYVNGKKVFSKKLTGDKVYESNTTEVVITDINTKDKAKDILIGNYTNDWCGMYLYLNHFQYKSKKFSKEDDVLATLEKIQKDSPTNNNFDWNKEVMATDCIDGIGKNFTTTGNGKLKWHVCLSPRNNWVQFVHGTMTLKLNSKKNIVLSGARPSGSITQIGNTSDQKNPSMTTLYSETGKKLYAYKAAGSSKKAYTITKGAKIKLVGYQYSGKKLYFQIKNSNGKKGWIDANRKDFICRTDGYVYGTLHA